MDFCVRVGRQSKSIGIRILGFRGSHALYLKKNEQSSAPERLSPHGLRKEIQHLVGKSLQWNWSREEVKMRMCTTDRPIDVVSDGLVTFQSQPT
jgi:hypothetical protein